MKTTEKPTETGVVDMEPKIPRKPSRLDPYREQVIFWHLHGEKQEWMAAELKRLYGVAIDRSNISRWLRKHSAPLQNQKTRSNG